MNSHTATTRAFDRFTTAAPRGGGTTHTAAAGDCGTMTVIGEADEPSPPEGGLQTVRLANLLISPLTIMPDTSTSASVEIENTASTEQSVDVQWTLTSNGTQLASDTATVALAGGETRTSTFEFTPSNQGLAADTPFTVTAETQAGQSVSATAGVEGEQQQPPAGGTGGDDGSAEQPTDEGGDGLSLGLLLLAVAGAAAAGFGFI